MLDVTALIAFFLCAMIKSSEQVRIENLFLRYQLLVYRRTGHRARFLPLDRQILATLARGLKSWRQACFAMTPETVLSWHRRLQRWKWTYRHPRIGRPRITRAIASLVVRMRRNNPLWGAKRLHGELLKLGYRLSESSVRNILRAAGFEPDPGGATPSPDWRRFITMHRKTWAIDCFSVESAFLKTCFVAVVIDIKTRALVAAQVAFAKPDGEWIANVLRSKIADLGVPDLLIHDHDTVFRSEQVQHVLRTRGVRSAMTPVMAPMANAYVERVIGTLRRECTDHFLFTGRRHLQLVLDEYRQYYNGVRCHQGIDQRIPEAPDMPRLSPPDSIDEIRSRPILGGLHHEYFVD